MTTLLVIIRKEILFSTINLIVEFQSQWQANTFITAIIQLYKVQLQIRLYPGKEMNIRTA